MALAMVNSDAEPKSVASLDVLEFMNVLRQNARMTFLCSSEPYWADTVGRTGVPVPVCLRFSPAGHSLGATLPINCIVTKGLQRVNVRKDEDRPVSAVLLESLHGDHISRLFISVR